MKRHRHIGPLSTVLLFLLPVANPTSAVVLDTVDSGWYCNGSFPEECNTGGYHLPTNENYLAGKSAFSEYRNFFVFDLSDLTLPVTAASLAIDTAGYSGELYELYYLYDFSLPIARLVAGGTHRDAVFIDLGSGTEYAFHVYAQSIAGTLQEIELNDAAIADINAARGGLFALGGRITTLPGTVFRMSGPPATRQLVLTIAACSDSIDNDGDGAIDFGVDPGCESDSDDSERATVTTALGWHTCDDGVDNDADGKSDFPEDPGCSASWSITESPPCSDGLDNDDDGFLDFPDDPECASAHDTSETTAGDQSCGLGFELVFIAPALMWLRGRRGHRRAIVR